MGVPQLPQQQSPGPNILLQCFKLIFCPKIFEIQTKFGPKFQENLTKSRPNLTLSRTGFTKTGPNPQASAALKI